MLSMPLLAARVRCPCCGYPTLAERAGFEICELCDWEDDGQPEGDAGAARGGPNGDYSLAEARRNFARFRVMYRPGDGRLAASPGAETKARLMAAFDSLAAGAGDPENLASEILRLEDVLHGELIFGCTGPADTQGR